ncbi:MAG: PLP-dependent decarboxylase, partial [Ignavibacteria bacterium]
YTKESCGKKLVLTDGGIHHLLRPALIGQAHPIINLTAISNDIKEQEEYIVAGPLCTSLDQFSNSILLNKTEPGDIFAILNAGAYGFTESMPLFLSHEPAKELFID